MTGDRGSRRETVELGGLEDLARARAGGELVVFDDRNAIRHHSCHEGREQEDEGEAHLDGVVSSTVND